ncbi:MAG: isocitrate lyase/phosphoenolpyruvate mutase family protein [Proteobacteria bacterium]|nr:isocitrate lyase/phosphoenolpyruvate mutase family protein [Pseudomonadota bacterium]
MDTTQTPATFRELHQSGCFVIANPWDIGSARYLASLGFRALATTSAGLSFSMGRPDCPTSLNRAIALQNIRDLVEATVLPVNADFQAGYGDAPEDVAESVALCVGTGVAGLSIEDATGDDDHPLYELPVALARLRAARAAIDSSGRDVLLTGRAECFLVGHPSPLRESIERLVAYADAGADCLFAPGLKTPEQVREVVAAVSPRPVNVLAADPSWMTLHRLADLGVRRISVGSALARVAWSALMAAASEIATDGTFAGLTRAESFTTLNRLFSD